MKLVYSTTQVLDKNLSDLKLEEMKCFTVTSGSAQRDIFQSIVDPKHMISNETYSPWKEEAEYSDIFKNLMLSADDNTPAFGLTYDQVSKYFLDVHGGCSSLFIYDMKQQRHEYTSVWYYSVHVPFEHRFQINKPITELRENGDIRKILERETVSPLAFECGTFHSHKIRPFVFNLTIAVCGSPFFLFVVFSLAKETLKQITSLY